MIVSAGALGRAIPLDCPAMLARRLLRARALAVALATLLAASMLALALPALAGAHARVSPAVSLANQLQLYSLAVPTEKSGLRTTKIVMTVPSGFGIDSFVPPPPGWRQHIVTTGKGDNAIVEKVTWTGGRTPTGEDSLFQFLAGAPAGTYTFLVQQTYSDGSIVNWDGGAGSNSAAPAPTIEIKSSLGGGGSSLLSIIALVAAVLALLAAGLALAGGRGGSSGPGRPLV